MTTIRVEHDAATGEVKEIPLTEAEQAEKQAEDAAAQEKAATDAATREAAIAHAKSLGFTDAMIAVMYPALAQ